MKGYVYCEVCNELTHPRKKEPKKRCPKHLPETATKGKPKTAKPADK